MRFKAPSIRDKGLRKHLEELGVDYELFERLHLAHLSDAAIAKALNRRNRKKIKEWRIVYTEEQQKKALKYMREAKARENLKNPPNSGITSVETKQ